LWISIDFTQKIRKGAAENLRIIMANTFVTIKGNTLGLIR